MLRQKRFANLGMICILALLGAPSLSLAQDATAKAAAAPVAQAPARGTVNEMWVIIPTPGHEAKFEAGMKKHLAWRKSAGEKLVWRGYVPVVGDDLTGYAFRSEGNHWRDFDANEAWEKSAKAQDQFNADVAPHVLRYSHYFDEFDVKNSWWKDDPQHRFYGVTSYRFKSGTRGQVVEALGKVHQAVTASKWPFNYSVLDVTGGSTDMVLVFPFRNYAEMAEPEPTMMSILSKSLGSDEAARAVFTQFGSAVKSRDYNVYEFRPDLSTPK